MKDQALSYRLGQQDHGTARQDPAPAPWPRLGPPGPFCTPALGGRSVHAKPGPTSEGHSAPTSRQVPCCLWPGFQPSLQRAA